MLENISSVLTASRIAQTLHRVLQKPYWVLRSPVQRDATADATFVVISFDELMQDAMTEKFAQYYVEEKVP